MRPVTAVVDDHWTRAEPLGLSSRTAKAIKVLLFRTPARLYLYDPLLERLSQDLQDVAAVLGELIQEEHAVVPE
jgi:hypothetical protein